MASQETGEEEGCQAQGVTWSGARWPEPACPLWGTELMNTRNGEGAGGMSLEDGAKEFELCLKEP